MRHQIGGPTKPKFPPAVYERVILRIIEYRFQGLFHNQIREALESEFGPIPMRTYERIAAKAKRRMLELMKNDQSETIAKIKGMQEKLFQEAKIMHLSRKHPGVLAVANQILDSHVKFLQHIGYLPTSDSPLIKIENKTLNVTTAENWLNKKKVLYVRNPDSSSPEDAG